MGMEFLLHLESRDPYRNEKALAPVTIVISTIYLWRSYRLCYRLS